MSNGSKSNEETVVMANVTVPLVIPTDNLRLVKQSFKIVTAANCQSDHGISQRFLHKAARNGLVHWLSPDGVSCRLADLEEWLVNEGSKLSTLSKPAKSSDDSSQTGEDEVDQVLMQAGARKVKSK